MVAVVTGGNTNRATLSTGFFTCCVPLTAVQVVPEAQGNKSPSRLWTPPNAQEICVPEHCVPLSAAAIDVVVSTMTAMLYGVFEPPAMSEVETAAMLKLQRWN